MENFEKFKQFQLSQQAQKSVVGGVAPIKCSFGGDYRDCPYTDLMDCAIACNAAPNCGGCYEVIGES